MDSAQREYSGIHKRVVGFGMPGRIREHFTTLKRRRELRRLQKEYYEAAGKDEQVISEYLQVLERAREREIAGAYTATKPRCLHAGSGGHLIRGWINCDREVATTVDLVSDLGAAIPLRTNSLDHIHSEDFLEHLDLTCGMAFLAEAFRVLRPGGVMRLLTPDLKSIVKHVYLRAESRHLNWCNAYLQATGPCEALNMHLRMDGEHRFLYDEVDLRQKLRSVGFAVTRVRYNTSKHVYLRYLDLRDFGLNLFFECTKPQDGRPPST